MTYNEVYNMIAAVDTKESNVVITTKAHSKQFRQNLYISSANQLKIRGTNANIVGYNVSQEMTDKWESMRLVKKRVNNC